MRSASPGWRAIAALAALSLATVWAGTSLWLRAKSGAVATPSHAQYLDLSDPRVRKLLCGPRSLSTAIRRLGLGIPDRFQEAMRTLRLTAQGVAFEDLLRLASEFQGIRAQRRRLTWDELLQVNGTALLFVKENHFVAVDPRETRQAGGRGGRPVRVYEDSGPTRWMSREELAATWKGEAITLQRREPKPYKGGPRIVWESCLIDAGFFRRDDMAVCRFRFKNLGDAELRLEKVKKSCSCARFEVSNRRIAPGGAGWVEGSSKLSGRRGKFGSFLTVFTNDPVRPVEHLVMDAFVYNDHILSADVVHFGQLPQGFTRVAEVFLHDPGEEELEVHDVCIELEPQPNMPNLPVASVEMHRVRAGEDYVGAQGAYPVKPGDYVIRPKVAVPPDCSVGVLKGRIVAQTNLAKPLGSIEVPLEGEIISHVISRPAAAMLTLGGNSHSQILIRLESLSGQAFEVERAWTSENALIRIIRQEEQTGHLCYLVQSLPQAATGVEQLVQCDVNFKFADGSMLGVPVTIYRR